MTDSTMSDMPLTVGRLLIRGRDLFPDSEVVTWTPTGQRRTPFAEVARRARALAGGLRELGVGPGDRVGVLAANVQEYVEAYLGIPGMGAVLHTVNTKLQLDQLAEVIDHAQDRVLIVDDELLDVLAPVAPRLGSVERIVTIGDSPTHDRLPVPQVGYEDLLASATPLVDWPDVDERSAAALCYTTGTTGDPKGVAYSHRSTVLHALAFAGSVGKFLSDHDRFLVVVPLFHVNGWGLPHVGWMVGADLVLPGRSMQPADVCRLITAERPTVSGGVPAVWSAIADHAEAIGADLSSIEILFLGGSAPSAALVERLQRRHGVRVVQAWGMTETSPMVLISAPPRSAAPGSETEWTVKAGRPVPLIEVRIADEAGAVLPADGTSVGELEVRGPWITARYYERDAADRFHDGWLRTGDLAVIEPSGFVRITDRVKDVIKSGGEWISSVRLEELLAGHPDVVEAAVIGIPDPRWDERPFACVVLRPGAVLDVEALGAHLAAAVPRWWVPQSWTAVTDLPRTSVGKIDKKALRADFHAGRLRPIGGAAVAAGREDVR